MLVTVRRARTHSEDSWIAAIVGALRTTRGRLPSWVTTISETQGLLEAEKSNPKDGRLEHAIFGADAVASLLAHVLFASAGDRP